MQYQKILFSKNNIYLSVILIFLFQIYIGNFEYRIVPDTSSYIEALNINDPSASKRTPIFGIILEIFSSGYQYFPIFNFFLLLISIAFFCRSLNLIGFSSKFFPFIYLVFGFSNISLFYTSMIHPEVMANSLFLLSIAIIIRYTQKEFLSFFKFFIFGVIELFLVLLKPSFLLIIFILPLFYLLLKRALDNISYSKNGLKNFIFLILSGILFLSSYSGIRYIFYDDFHFVSYSGYNSIGLSSQLIDETTIPKLRVEHRELAKDILKHKRTLEEKGLLLSYPKNLKSSIKHSKLIGYFDISARNYDTLSNISISLQGKNENWIAFNQRMQVFTNDVIISEKKGYFFYVFGASSRFIGKTLTSNIPFVFFFIIFLLYFFFKKSEIITQRNYIQFYILTLISTTIFLTNLIPAISISFPAQRYIDAAGFSIGLIPSFLVYLALKKGLE